MPRLNVIFAKQEFIAIHFRLTMWKGGKMAVPGMRETESHPILFAIPPSNINRLWQTTKKPASKKPSVPKSRQSQVLTKFAPASGFPSVDFPASTV